MCEAHEEAAAQMCVHYVHVSSDIQIPLKHQPASEERLPSPLVD